MNYFWVPSSSGSVPHNAVVAGRDINGETLYAGRAFHEGDLLPCKVSGSLGGGSIAYGGQEVTKHSYEVLCGANVAWQYSRDGQVPYNAIVMGTTSDGEKLYMGRALHHGSMTPGKIHPSHGCLYIPFGGDEHRYHEYEVLVQI